MIRRVRMVMVPLVLVLVACLGMRPALADWNDGGAWNVDDADMGIKWGPTSVGGDRKGFVMVSDNRYNACLMLCGISINDERLTADAKAKLSNSGTGGGFYLLAQRFGQYGSEGNLPDWANPDAVIAPGPSLGFDVGSMTANSAIRTCAAMYGKDATWWGDFTELERTNALRDLVAVLNGTSSGGGGTTDDFGGTYVIDYSNWHHSSKISWADWYVPSAALYVSYVKFDDGIQSQISANYDQYPFVYLVGYTMGSGREVSADNIHVKELWLVMAKSRLSVVEPDTSWSNYCRVVTDGSGIDGVIGVCLTRRKYNSNNNHLINNGKTYTFTAGTSDFTLQSDTFKLRNGALWLVPVNVGPATPPTQWPDSPNYEPPTAPVVPDPTEPTVPSEPSAPTPVEPVQPDPPTPGQNPVFNDQPTYTDDTFTADLQGILDALDEHCKHLQDALYANVSDLYNKLSTKLTNDLSNLKSFLHGEYGWLNNARHNDAVTTWDYLKQLFSWLGGLVSDNFYSLNQHLTQLFNWLAEQFDFSFTGTGYNDDTVVSWLKKIYSKLGTGMNTRPNDPVAEPDSFGDWLTRLLQNFIGDLLSVGQEAVGGLLNDFQQLATKFPFCVPWDIAALLALFVAEPVAPVFDLPAYTITQNGLTQVSTYHISLADYNVAWEAVRFAEKIGFAVFLAWNTTHFREFLSGRGES